MAELTTEGSMEPTTDGWMPVFALSALTDGRPLRVSVGEEDVLLCRAGERIFAVANRCTHQGAPLHRGRVKATGSTPTVTCAAHGSIFLLTDGRVLRGPASTPIAVYDARVNGDMVEVRARP